MKYKKEYLELVDLIIEQANNKEVDVQRMINLLYKIAQ